MLYVASGAGIVCCKHKKERKFGAPYWPLLAISGTITQIKGNYMLL
jgi:hypothetical protein